MSCNTAGGLAARFLDPPSTFGPTPIWWWSGERLEPARLRWQLERFAEGAIGALVVMNLAPSGPLVGCDADDPPFFSEEWWQIFRGVCRDAADLGLQLYFYDQIGFSGANIQGEIVTRNPEFAGQAVHRVAQVATTPTVVDCPPEGEPLMACAVPVDDADRCIGPPIPLPLEGRRARWPGSQRPHRVMLAYRVVLGFDYFSPDACRELVDVIHGAYETQVGDYFGEVILGSFQDELPSMPTWSARFASQFAACYGYDLVPYLAALWEDYGAEAKRVRRDYHATRGTLAEEAFFKPLYRWHADRGLISGFDQQDSSRAGFPVDTVEQYADYPRTHRWFGAPGSDHHGDAKIHSSLAHAYDRERVWIEAFHSSGWGGTLEETFDWLIPWLRAGATLYNPHAVYYSTRGGWWEWAPPSTDWRQPYWRHHDRFATAIARLCSVLTLGRHVCDVAVLHPTATVQAGATLDGPTAEAERADSTYLELVGQLRWYDARPGSLDRACRDFDVLDDASLDAGVVRDGALCVGQEAYSAVVLPACTEVDDAGAERLAELAAAGGTVIAVETVPSTLVALADSGDIRVAARAEDVPELLAENPPRVRAPVPTLLREIDDVTVLFVPATSSRATRVAEGGGGSHRWTRISYEFDPAAYARTVTVTVRGVTGEPALWQPYGGSTRRLTTRRWDDPEATVEIDVPFEDAPGALVVWRSGSEPPPAGSGPLPAQAPGGEMGSAGEAQVLDGLWRVGLEPTLDNRWGDFAYPADETSPPLERWDFRRRAEVGAEEDWSGPDVDDAEWDLVRATFGPHGQWRPEDEDEWRPVRYSASRGIAKDPVHDASLGPKGHVPEEFLDFGVVRAGRSVRFRAAVEVPEPRTCHLAVAAAARKEGWLGGVQVFSGEEQGYLALHLVSLEAGRNLLELRLTAEDDVRLRGSFAFVTDPQMYRRPEWMAVPGPGRMGSTASFATQFDVGSTSPLSAGVVHLGSATPCRLFVNDVEIVRQGGFYPYLTSFDVKRIGVYDIDHALRRGTNVLRVDASDLGNSVAILVDGVVTTGGGDQTTVQSGAHWRARRDGVDVDPVLRRAQRYDPAWAHAWRRPHPLPEAAWLEGEREGADTVLRVRAGPPLGGVTAEWLRLRLPPGATRMRCLVHGTPRLWIDGVETPCQVSEALPGEARSLEADLPGTRLAERVGALRVEPAFGYCEGAVLAGPVAFDVAEGTISLGDWQEQGLAGYSGGVRYRRSFDHVGAAGRLLLDLGRVRGTAEVRVNGAPAGVRIWSPYTFDVTEMVQPGENKLEILVLNTLGPYMDAASPTHFVFAGQVASGLFGPVRLLTGGPPEPPRIGRATE